MNKHEHDALPADDRRIAELLGSLARVEAPSNFEFGLRARIAEGTASPRSILLPFLKFAAPLTLLILIGVFVVFYNSKPAGSDVAVAPSVAPVQSSNETTLVPQPAGPRQLPAANESTPTYSAGTDESDPKADPDAARSNRNIRRGSGVAVPPEGGSRDITISPANTKLPRGFESQENRRDSNSNNDDVRIPLREVFGILGIVADYSDGGWTVKSRADGSMSAKSGVKAGDILHSVDGQRLEKDTSFKPPFSAKSIRVRREGKELDLNLGN